MEMIKCPKCSNTLSNRDSMCMQCGLDIYSINHELKQNELVKDGIIDEKKKKKTFIVVLELTLLFVIVVTYIILFVPKIIEISKEKPIEHIGTEKDFDDLINEIE